MNTNNAKIHSWCLKTSIHLKCQEDRWLAGLASLQKHWKSSTGIDSQTENRSTLISEACRVPVGKGKTFPRNRALNLLPPLYKFAWSIQNSDPYSIGKFIHLSLSNVKGRCSQWSFSPTKEAQDEAYRLSNLGQTYFEETHQEGLAPQKNHK